MSYLRLLGVATLICFSSLALASDPAPQRTHDGLELRKQSRSMLVYAKPGAELSGYSKLAILKAYVAFKDDWKKHYNQDVDFEHRLRDSDLQRIREEVAEEFAKIFSEVLSEEGGHELVSQGAEGVLIIRPAIIDLQVTAPDVMSAGRDDVYAGSAGAMTLYMELLDGVTGELLFRVIDAEAAGDDIWRIRNRVTNRADADRVLRRWAEQLNKHLATVKNG